MKLRKQLATMALALMSVFSASAIEQDEHGFYLINNTAEYEEFAALVNGGQTTISAQLLADIPSTSVCIANTVDVPFTGIFNGNGHTVTLNINNPDNKMRGLIGCVAGGAVVMNVVVDGTVIGNGNTGGIVGGTIEKGTGSVLIMNCGNEATVTGKSCTAGILGKNRSSGSSDGEKVKVYVINCYNAGAITGSEKAAAICGEFGATDRIFNCYNVGTTTPASSTPFGRYVEGAKFRNCWTIPSNKGSKEVSGVNVVSADDAMDEILAGLNTVTPIFVAGATHPVLHSTALPEDGVFVIDNVQDFAYYAYLVKGGLGHYGAKLAADLDNVTVPVGDFEHGLVSDFDGQGHTVTLALNNESETGSSDYRAQALIASVGAITVKNVTVKGFVYGNNYVAGVVGRILPTAEGVLTISNCGNEATINGVDNVAGVISGYSTSDKNVKVVMTNCYNVGQVNGSSYVVALAASLGNGAELTNCYHAGEVIASAGYSSKPFARYDSATFTNCYTLPIAGKTFADGITEIEESSVVSGELCYNLGKPFTQNLGQDAHPTFGHNEVVFVDGEYVNPWNPEFDTEMYYTITNKIKTDAYWHDNGSDNVLCYAKGSEADFYWTLVPTKNKDCYNIKSVATNRYLQAHGNTTEVEVLLGAEPAEYHIAYCEAEGAYGFASTNNPVYDFTAGCVGLNLKKDPNEAGCCVQTFAAVAGTNHRSFWLLESVEPTATGISNATVDAVKVVKALENGQIIIVRNGVKYNAAGVQMK